MILLLFAALFCIPFVRASLLGLNDTHILILDASDNSSSHTRTLWDILSSCGITLFACTWTAIHPDIPGKDEGVAAIFLRRLLLMVMAFLAPEFAVAWAACQYIHARRFVKDCENVDNISDSSKISSAVFTGWTLTHGFFADMGGFVLYVNGELRAILTPDELLRFVRDGSVEIPVITKAEIDARSKGDILSKCIAILHLVWFVIKLIVRYFRNLPVTLLEIDTLGVVALTFMSYVLWFRKPKDAQLPYIVHWKDPTAFPLPESFDSEIWHIINPSESIIDQTV
ncbi:hypothetical protein BDR03DRAFT_1013146 [Suillus americanus]|nr:hypothetical protein BDR03DRAFT_1013146 [Suillus americanus]